MNDLMHLMHLTRCDAMRCNGMQCCNRNRNRKWYTKWINESM